MAELQELQEEVVESDVAQSESTTGSLQEDSQDVQSPSTVTAEPRVIAKKKGPVSLAGEQSTALDLPVDQSVVYITHLEIRATKVRVAACRGFFVTYEDKAAHTLFWSEWNVWNDRVAMGAFDPASGSEVEGLPKKRCGLRWGAAHHLTIVEDQTQYEVFLDGNMVGQIARTGNPTAAARIKVQSWYATRLEVSKFFVEAK